VSPWRPGGGFEPQAIATVPATSANLGPGFDCLALALEVRDRFAVEVIPRGGPDLLIEAHGPGAGAISRGPDNLVYQAFTAVLKHLGRPVPPVRLRITNAIPIGRGLGSSAAAIVAGACLGRAAAGGGMDDVSLVALATELEGHPDNVAAAFYGGLTLATQGGGGALHVTRCGAIPGFRAVIAVPDFAFSTHAARVLLPTQVTLDSAVFNLGRAATLVAGLLTGDSSAVHVGMEDRLHQPYRAKALPFLNDVIAAALSAGAVGAALSGAGPSVLALVEAGKEGVGATVGQAMVDALSRAGHRAEAFESAISSRGAVVELG